MLLIGYIYIYIYIYIITLSGGSTYGSLSITLEELGWHSVESTRFPLMWPGLKSRRRRHVWVVVGSLPCSERFFSGYSGFPLSLKTNTFKFQFELERTDTFQRVLRTPNCSVGKQISKFYQTSKSSGSTTEWNTLASLTQSDRLKYT